MNKKSITLLLIVGLLMFLLPLFKTIYFEINKKQVKGTVVEINKDNEDFIEAIVSYNINDKDYDNKCFYPLFYKTNEGSEEVIYYNKNNVKDYVCINSHITKIYDPISMIGIFLVIVALAFSVIDKKSTLMEELKISIGSLIGSLIIAFMFLMLYKTKIVVSSLFMIYYFTFLILAVIFFLAIFVVIYEYKVRKK